MMKMINTVIFDMDGLMFDTEKIYIELFQDIVKRNGYTFPKELLLDMLGTSDYDLFEIRKQYPWIDNVLEQADHEFDEFFFSKCTRASSANKLGLEELYRYLKEHKYKIAIASSSSLSHIKKLIDYCGFEFEADLILSAQGKYPSKPAPDLFLACATQLNCLPEECLVLEDSRHGIQAAYRAKMHRVWIPDQVGFNETDMQYVEYQKESLLDVIDILEVS